MFDDATLLRRYATTRDEPAFAELVKRHVDGVYSVALRRAGYDAHLAEDIVQQVFVALAREAQHLSGHPVLTGWLYTTTRYIAASAVRSERRRKHREQEAHAMQETDAPDPAPVDWRQIGPVLDDALDTLAEPDRIAVLLRFTDRRSYAEIGTVLGIAEEAARKRVDRAVDKLRVALGRRGVVSTASVLAGVLTESAVVAAPAKLAASVTGAVLSGGAAVAAGAITFMTVTKLQVGFVAAALVLGTGGLVWQQQQINHLHAASEAQEKESALRSVENARLARDQVASAKQVTDLRAEITALKSAALPANRPAPAAAASASRPTTGSSAAPASSALNELKLSRMDTLLRLTPEQRAKAVAIFAKEAETLSLFATIDERIEKGDDARRATKHDLRELMTPEQRAKYDVSPQSLGGGLPADPAMIVNRLEQTIALTPEQKKRASEIIWDEVTDQLAAIPVTDSLRGFAWTEKVRAQLRATLTPEQQAIFDATPPYGKIVRAAGTPSSATPAPSSTSISRKSISTQPIP